MEQVYLGLGSSIGDRMHHLKNAENAISNLDQVLILASSSFYESSPWGGEAKNLFLNIVLHIETLLSAESLLEKCIEIEEKLGRKRVRRWGDRIIDIDILLFGPKIIRTDRLTVPHPYLLERMFLLKPLADISDTIKIPGQDRTLDQLLTDCPDRNRIQKIEAESVMEELGQ